MNLTIALAQTDSRIGDLAGNLRRHLAAIDQARDGGADLVVFPELSLSGYSLKDIAAECVLREGDPSPVAEILRRSEEISVLFGCAEESEDFGVYNSAFLAEGGRLARVHRKVYPPTYGMFEERRYFSAGAEVRAARSRLGLLGVLICEDLWHLPLPYLLAKEGAQILIGMAASPTRLSGSDARIRQAQVNTEQHRSYARLLSSYVVFCNRVGYEDGVNFWGGSEVIGPQGEAVVQAKLFEEDMVFAEILPDEVRRARRHSRHFLDDELGLVVREGRRIMKGPGPGAPPGH
jgi:predicted amidohydrolase